MSDANIDLVRPAYDAFARGDIPAVLAAFDPDITFGIVGQPGHVPHFGPHRGREAVAEFFRQYAEAMEVTRFEPRRWVAAEDLVLVFGHSEYRMRRSGATGAHDWLHVWTLRDGRIVAHEAYEDTASIAAAFHG